jgi:hypothetical protein
VEGERERVENRRERVEKEEENLEEEEGLEKSSILRYESTYINLG